MQEPYPAPYQHGVHHYHHQPPVRGTNGLAVASLVLGIVWLCGFGSLLAVIFGHIALNQIKMSGENGRGLAVAGLTLGYVGVSFYAVWIFAAIVGGAAS